MTEPVQSRTVNALGSAYHATEKDIVPGATFGYIVVAVVGEDKDWAAYRALTDQAPEEVAGNGDKITKEAAEALFPVMK